MGNLGVPTASRRPAIGGLALVAACVLGGRRVVDLVPRIRRPHDAERRRDRSPAAAGRTSDLNLLLITLDTTRRNGSVPTAGRQAPRRTWIALPLRASCSSTPPPPLR
jgi:hypothetical protein